RVGAHHQDAPLRVLREAGPDLLAGHDDFVAAPLAPRAERGQVRAGAGLGEALAPELLAAQERRQEALALPLLAMGDQRRPDQRGADRELDQVRRLGARVLLPPDQTL